MAQVGRDRALAGSRVAAVAGEAARRRARAVVVAVAARRPEGEGGEREASEGGEVASAAAAELSKGRAAAAVAWDAGRLLAQAHACMTAGLAGLSERAGHRAWRAGRAGEGRPAAADEGRLIAMKERIPGATPTSERAWGM